MPFFYIFLFTPQIVVIMGFKPSLSNRLPQDVLLCSSNLHMTFFLFTSFFLIEIVSYPITIQKIQSPNFYQFDHQFYVLCPVLCRQCCFQIINYFRLRLSLQITPRTQPYKKFLTTRLASHTSGQTSACLIETLECFSNEPVLAFDAVKTSLICLFSKIPLKFPIDYLRLTSFNYSLN